MLLSRACEYALQALLHLASVPKGQYVLVREIAEAYELSYPFLGKVIHTLVKNRLLDSQKGRGGGLTLAKPADEITFLEVIRVMEGPDFLQGCVLGLPRCGEPNPCPLHSQWAEVKEGIIQMFANRTVAQLLESVDQRKKSANSSSNDLHKQFVVL
jgi:Rrf2 family protein